MPHQNSTVLEELDLTLERNARGPSVGVGTPILRESVGVGRPPCSHGDPSPALRKGSRKSEGATRNRVKEEVK